MKVQWKFQSLAPRTMLFSWHSATFQESSFTEVISIKWMFILIISKTWPVGQIYPSHKPYYTFCSDINNTNFLKVINYRISKFSSYIYKIYQLCCFPLGKILVKNKRDKKYGFERWGKPVRFCQEKTEAIEKFSLNS